MERRIMANSSILRDGERLDDLQCDELQIIQNPRYFCFGMDAVLLSSFAKAPRGGKVVDLCTGNGIIPLLLSAKTEVLSIYGIEIQEEIADMARRSVDFNGLNERINIVNGNIKEALQLTGGASFDVVTVNPPYMIRNHGKANDEGPKAIARHEIHCTLEDVTEVGAKLLKEKGHFYMVHRPFRLAEIMCSMKEVRLEPKRMRMVYPYVDDEPNMVLIEGVKGANPGMVVEKPLIVYKEVNVYTEELLKMYGMTGE